MKRTHSSGARHRSRTALAVSGLCLGWALSTPVSGAHKNEPVQKNQPLTFPVATRQVQVSVVVQDKAGAPVRDLTAADFEIFEKGKEQKIEAFSVEAETLAVRATAEADLRPPTVFDNLNGRRGGVTVILLDRLNTAWEDQTYAKKQIVKFLGQIQPNDRVGLYLLESNTIRILHDITADVSSLLRAIGRYTAAGSAELAASQTRAEQTGETDVDFDVFLRESARNINAAFLRRRAETTAEAFVAIANHLTGFSGRKNLVWVSSAFPLTFDELYLAAFSSQDLSRGNVSQEVQRATRAMSEAGVAVYPVDARGIVGAFAVDPATIQATPGANRPMSTVFTTMDTALPSIDAAETIAENTGGRAFHNTNDLSGAIRRAIDDARVTYLLGYSPTHGEWDGRFREIKVKVKRPGVEVRHRRGYLALPLEEAGKSKATPVLTRALQSPLEATGITMGVNLERVEAPGDSEVNLAIRVDPRPFTLEPKGGKWHGSVALVIAQINAEGRAFRDFDQIIELNLTEAMKEQLLTHGVTISKKIRLRDDLHRLSVVVSDPPTGAVGSVIVPADKVKAALGR